MMLYRFVGIRFPYKQSISSEDLFNKHGIAHDDGDWKLKFTNVKKIKSHVISQNTNNVY